jgi:hypothetical protein
MPRHQCGCTPMRETRMAIHHGSRWGRGLGAAGSSPRKLAALSRHAWLLVQIGDVLKAHGWVKGTQNTDRREQLAD